MKRTMFAVSATATILAFATLAVGQKVGVKGMIISRAGETMVVKSDTGTNSTVVLTASTITKDNRGMLGVREEEMGVIVLIPGLKVDVEGTSDAQGRIVATRVNVDGDDLEASEMIQAGLHPTAEQVAANMKAIEANRREIEGLRGDLAAARAAASNQPSQPPVVIERTIRDSEDLTKRFMALTDFDVKHTTTVNFDVGSSTISAKDQEELKKLAQATTGMTGYIVEVMGYADATGDAKLNTKLSEDRAKAVVTYLVQQGKVPVRHIVAPAAMGEFAPLTTNESATGRAQNRRVEAKILVNKGLAGTK